MSAYTALLQVLQVAYVQTSNSYLTLPSWLAGQLQMM